MTNSRVNKQRTVALAGCGAIAPMHVQALQSLESVRLVALADPDAGAARRLLGLFAPDSQIACYASLGELLAGHKIDVVHICTPHHTHVPLAVEALRHGCHVVLEKPPAISLDDLAALEAAVGAGDRSLGVCFQNRFNLASQQARHLLETGKLEPVRTARAFVTWKRDAAYYGQAAWRGRWATEGGGVMINQAIHTLDLLLLLAGRPIRVEGTIANRHLREEIEVEDTAEMHIELGSGARAVFYATTAYGADAPVFLELDCTSSRLRLEGDAIQLLDRNGQPQAQKTLDELLAASPAFVPLPEPAAAAAQNGKACWGLGHQRLISAFYASLEPGQAPFPIGLSSASLALKTLLALYQSDRSGQPVTIR